MRTSLENYVELTNSVVREQINDRVTCAVSYNITYAIQTVTHDWKE